MHGIMSDSGHKNTACLTGAVSALWGLVSPVEKKNKPTFFQKASTLFQYFEKRYQNNVQKVRIADEILHLPAPRQNPIGVCRVVVCSLEFW